MQAMSLATKENNSEQLELKELQMQLETTQSMLKSLSQQLSLLKDQVLYFF